MPDEQTVQWQARMDREFPRGASAAWVSLERTSYHIPRIIVLRVEGGCPVVLLPVFSGSDKVLGPWHVSSYQPTGPRTGVRGARVSFADVKREMVWNSRVAPRLATLMAPERATFLKLAPHGGPEAQHSVEEQ